MLSMLTSAVSAAVLEWLHQVVVPLVAVGVVQALYGTQDLREYERALLAASARQYIPGVETRIFDRQGVLLATLKDRRCRPMPVPVAEVPWLTRMAFIAIEDERFLGHHGIDFRGIARAAFRNLQAGTVVEGGSTITQQLVKNRFLQPERTLRRKLLEAVLALELESAFSKDQLLEQYLNEIYFGRGLYGIGAAARYYFGKRPMSLTLAESAILAGMARAPNRFSPLKRSSEFKERQALVLAKMWQQGRITWAQLKQAACEPLKLAPPDPSRDESGRAPYFVAMVKRELIRAYGLQMVHAGGLQVTTTLDLAVQELAEKAFGGARTFGGSAGKDPHLQGAFVVLEPSTGEIRALVGGRDFESSQFDRATQARRQPGSAFKPVVYATALSIGLPANALFEDEPVFFDGEGFAPSWEPRNYRDEYHGTVTLAEALAWSYNAVAAKLLDQVGIPQTIAVARGLGISSPLPQGLSLALGSGDVTLLEMTSAFGVFAAGGLRAEPKGILRIRNARGNETFVASPGLSEALNAKTAFELTRMLVHAVEHGTGMAARVPGHVVAGKTGTTNGLSDAWFIGFTPDVVAGCYVGHDDHSPLHGGSSGGKVAAPIVGAFLREYLATRPASPFAIPDGIELYDICRETGQAATGDCPEVWELAFTAENSPEEYCDVHGPGQMFQEGDEVGTAAEPDEADPDDPGDSAEDDPEDPVEAASKAQEHGARRTPEETAPAEHARQHQMTRAPESAEAHEEGPPEDREDNPAAATVRADGTMDW